MVNNIFPANNDRDSGPSMIVVSSKGAHWSRDASVVDGETITETSLLEPAVVITETPDNYSGIGRNPSELRGDLIAEDVRLSRHSKPSIAHMLSNLRNSETLGTLTNISSQISTERGTGREVLHQLKCLSKFEQSFGVSIIFLLIALLILLIGTAIALVAYFRIRSSSDTYILKTFDITATDLLLDLDHSIQSKLRDVDAIEGMVSARAGSGFLRVSEFDAMMTNLRINSSYSVSIIKRVRQSDRSKALSIINSSYPSQNIVQDFWGHDLKTGKIVISPAAMEYLPTYLSYPPSNIPKFTNRNMDGVRKMNSVTYMQLFSTYSTYVASVDVPATSPSYALLLIRPAFDGIIRPSPPNVLRGQQYTGFVHIVLPYMDIVKDALSPKENLYSAMNIIIRDENSKAPSNSKVMFSSLNSDAPALNPADCSYLCRKMSINVDSTTIDVYVFVSDNWVSSQQSSVGWIALFVILFLFIIIVVLVICLGRLVCRSKRMLDEKETVSEIAVASLDIATKCDTKACEARAETRLRTLLTAMISHEIRTPINQVMGSLTVLEGVATSVFDHLNEIVKRNDDISRIKSDEAMVRECLTDAMASLDNLLSIANDVLEMSTMELGNFKFNKHRFDIIEAMESEFQSFAKSSLFTKRNIQFSLMQILHNGNDGGRVVNTSTNDVRDRLFVCGDDARVRQCLRVLVSNAAKFTENEGSIHVTIDLKMKSGTELIPSRSVCLCDVEHYDVIEVIVGVTDTGIGMNPNQTRKLFRTFEQGETVGADGISFRRQFGGTGLGLSIMKLLVVNGMGGLVTARSGGKGTGSSFEFKFPLFVIEQTSDMESMHVSDVEVVIDNYSVATLEARNDNYGGNSTVTDRPSHQKLNEVQGPETHETGVDCQSISAEVVDGMDNIGNVVFSLPPCTDDDNSGLNISQRKRNKGVKACVDGVDEEISSLDPSLTQQIEMTPAVAGLKVTNIQRRVLVVDDIEMNRKVLSRMVDVLGYLVDTAASGEDAVDIIESAAMNDNPFALVLMDVEMPGMYDGFQATERLRDSSIPGVRDITVVAVTAHRIDIIQDRARACGIMHCLAKPVKKIELNEVLSVI